MLSYQHHYHAGNHADVLKHWALIECVEHLQKKPTPFEYIDTHAGAGRYRLDSAEAQKVGEYKNGVGKLLDQRWPGLANYLEMVSDDVCRLRYPGSPEIVNRMLRDHDRSSLFELHPKTLRELQDNCARRRQTNVRAEDGLKGLLALLPVQSKRAIVLIDPSYEVKSEYDQVVSVMEKAWQKMTQATILLWYPVVDRDRINRLERQVKKTKIKNVQLFEMSLAEDDDKGMTGSGLVIVNPPWTLAEKFNDLMPKVSTQLSSDGKSRIRYQVLNPE